MVDRPPGDRASSVICKNPFCMRIFVVSSSIAPKGNAKVKLTCPGCGHEQEYKKEDFHRASGPEGTALNPV